MRDGVGASASSLSISAATSNLAADSRYNFSYAGDVMRTVQEYQHHAEECLKLALSVKPEWRATFEQMVQTWDSRTPRSIPKISR